MNQNNDDMSFLVTTNEAYSPFITEWFDAENNFNAEIGMIVYDLSKNQFTTDGKTWYDIEIYHL